MAVPPLPWTGRHCTLQSEAAKNPVAQPAVGLAKVRPTYILTNSHAQVRPCSIACLIIVSFSDGAVKDQHPGTRRGLLQGSGDFHS